MKNFGHTNRAVLSEALRADSFITLHCSFFRFVIIKIFYFTVCRFTHEIQPFVRSGWVHIVWARVLDLLVKRVVSPLNCAVHDVIQCQRIPNTSIFISQSTIDSSALDHALSIQMYMKWLQQYLKFSISYTSFNVSPSLVHVLTIIIDTCICSHFRNPNTRPLV